MSIPTLIHNLQNAQLYPHPILDFRVIETHISWIILTGKYCYKIKKPLDFQFLDFSSLEKRKFFCQKECELNRRLAPEIYLDIVAITGSENKPELNGAGEIIEYAIKMQEFPQNQLFTALLEYGQLQPSHIVALAKELATFHRQIDDNSPEKLGTPEQILEPVAQNFEQIRGIIQKAYDLNDLQIIEDWSLTEHKKLIDYFHQRKIKKFIRACHGDAHLGNIVWFKKKPVIFDCIEFNEALRWTDTMADVGFLLMDLSQRKCPELANLLLNTYLFYSGDYAGLKVLRYYQVYRAVVRAKIALYEFAQQSDPTIAEQRLHTYRNLIILAKHFVTPKKPFLLLMHGYSAAGKSTVAKLLAQKLGLIHLRSDVERKRLKGLDLEADSQSKPYGDLYTADISEKTYTKLMELTKISLQTDYATIVDATFQSQANRQAFIDYAKKAAIPIAIINCQASLEKRLNWTQLRKKHESFSEARREILLAQADKFEPLTQQELTLSITINTENPQETKVELTNCINQLEKTWGFAIHDPLFINEQETT